MDQQLLVERKNQNNVISFVITLNCVQKKQAPSLRLERKQEERFEHWVNLDKSKSWKYDPDRTDWPTGVSVVVLESSSSQESSSSHSSDSTLCCAVAFARHPCWLAAWCWSDQEEGGGFGLILAAIDERCCCCCTSCCFCDGRWPQLFDAGATGGWFEGGGGGGKFGSGSETT